LPRLPPTREAAEAAYAQRPASEPPAAPSAAAIFRAKVLSATCYVCGVGVCVLAAMAIGKRVDPFASCSSVGETERPRISNHPTTIHVWVVILSFLNLGFSERQKQGTWTSLWIWVHFTGCV